MNSTTMVVSQILLILSGSGKHDISCFIKCIDIILKCFYRSCLVICCDSWSFVSYFNWEHGFCAMDQKKGVSWVAALGVVRRLHSTEGSSSTQACLAFSRGASSRFFIPLHIRPLLFLTCQFDFGCATEVNFNLIPRLFTIVLEFFQCEVCPIICDYAVWYSEVKNYRLDEFNRGCRILGCHWGCFYPLGEFVDCYQRINMPSWPGLV
jgi:hypothetical protein